MIKLTNFQSFNLNEFCLFIRILQFLLTPADFSDAQRRGYWRKSMEDLMAQGIVPIINTNDAVDWKHEADTNSADKVGILSQIFHKL